MSVARPSLSGLENSIEPSDSERLTDNQNRITSEYRATQLFMRLAESTGNKAVVNVLNEVADENRVHVSESLKLLRELANEKEKFSSNLIVETEPITRNKP
jgi:rubrerythrin